MPPHLDQGLPPGVPDSIPPERIAELLGDAAVSALEDGNATQAARFQSMASTYMVDAERRVLSRLSRVLPPSYPYPSIPLTLNALSRPRACTPPTECLSPSPGATLQPTTELSHADCTVYHDAWIHETQRWQHNANLRAAWTWLDIRIVRQRILIVIERLREGERLPDEVYRELQDLVSIGLTPPVAPITCLD